MSAYTQFVKQHIRGAPGRTQKDKMRAVATAWRRQKGGRGAGLAPPGMHATSGGRVRRRRVRRGAGFFDDVWDGIKQAAKSAPGLLLDLGVGVAKKRFGSGVRSRKGVVRRRRRGPMDYA